MKIICIDFPNFYQMSQETMKFIFYLKSENSLIQPNKSFIIPLFSEEIYYQFGIVVKICKVGKNIRKQFAYRYYNKISLGINFTALDMLKACRNYGLPWEVSKSFDFSCAIGSFLDFNDLFNLFFSFYIDNELVNKFTFKDLNISLDEIISYVSAFITFKVGDVIFVNCTNYLNKVKRKNTFIGKINEQIVLNFDVI